MNTLLQEALQQQFDFYSEIYFETPDRWFHVLWLLGDRVSELPFKATQVKEKFGCLRVYHQNANEDEQPDEKEFNELHEAIVCAEKEVAKLEMLMVRPGHADS